MFLQAPPSLLLAALLLVLVRGAASQPLQRSSTYVAAFNGSTGPGVSVQAPGLVFAGDLLARVAASDPAACAAACDDAEDCRIFNYGCDSAQVSAGQ